MRKYKIKNNDFLRIFPRRSFTFRDKCLLTRLFIEDDNGNYSIEERASVIGRLTALLLLILTVALGVLWFGLRNIPDVLSDFSPAILGKALRRDGCHHGSDSTNELIKMAGWKNETI